MGDTLYTNSNKVYSLVIESLHPLLKTLLFYSTEYVRTVCFFDTNRLGNSNHAYRGVSGIGFLWLDKAVLLLIRLKNDSTSIMRRYYNSMIKTNFL